MRVILLAVVALTTVVLCSAADPECLYRKVRNLPAHWANPTDCRRFFKCSSKDVKKETKCSTNKEYDMTTGKCVSKGRGACKLSLLAPLAGVQNVCADQVSGAYMPQSGSCRSFYICNNNLAYSQNCDEGSLFNVTSGVCVLDKEKTCWENKCIGKADGTSVADDNECLTYYVCTQGAAVAQTCDAGSYFNTDDGNCQRDIGNKICWQNFCRSQPDGTSIPNTKECSQYYVCKNEQATQHECPAGNYFNRDVLECQPGDCPYDDNGCTEETPPPPEDCTCPGGYKNGEMVAHPTDCNLFYICHNGVLVETSCEAGNYFNTDKKACEPDLEGVCPQCETESRAKRSVEESVQYVKNVESVSNLEPRAAPECDCNNPEGDLSSCTCPGGYIAGQIVPHPTDCDKYYLCKNARLVEQSCGEGLYFNKTEHLCLIDTDHECWPLNGGICTDQSDNTKLPNPHQCNAYYLCNCGNATNVTCPEGQWFNPQVNDCQCDTEGVCLNPCLGTNGILNLPHPNCTQFYACNNGKATVQNCPPGTGFDASKQVCLASVNCKENICFGKPDGTTLPDPDDDTKFYFCNGGIASQHQCPPGATFNPNKGVCLAGPSSDCNQTKCSPAGTLTPPFQTLSCENNAFCICTDSGAMKEYCPSNYTFDPIREVCFSNAPCDPEICEYSPEYTVTWNRACNTSFCLCVSGEPVIVDCPKGGTFNPKEGICEQPLSPDPNCDPNYCNSQADNTVFPAENTFDGFCICINNIPKFELCPEGTKFSIVKGVCMNPQYSPDCDNTKCANSPNLVFPSPNNPNSYCYCQDNNTAVLKPCNKNQIFNPDKLVCVANPCDPAVCADGCSDGTTFPAIDFQYGYCVCNGNNSVLVPCPAGYIYNVQSQSCELEENDTCGCDITQCSAANGNGYPVPVPNDPYSFCYCLAPNNVVKMRCPNGKKFSAQKLVCVDANISEGCTCPGGYINGQIVAHPTDCEMYYICLNGVLQEQDCGAGSYFNKADGICKLDTDGICSGGGGNGCTCVGAYREGELVAHPTNNQLYYVCSDNKLYEQSCGIGNIFNSNLSICVPNFSARSKSKQQQGPAVEYSNWSCKSNEKRSVPSNCSQYDICLNNRWERKNCAEFLYYNPEQRQCLEPRDDTVCKYAKVTHLPICDDSTEHQTLPTRSAQNCTASYFRCTKGQWILKYCQKGEYYAPQLQACIAFSLAGNHYCSQSTSMQSNDAKIIAKPQSEHTTVRHYIANCAMYLMCLEGVWWYQYCPLGMYFNTTYNNCMPNDAHQCQDASIKDPLSAVVATSIVQLPAFVNEKCSFEGTIRPSALACDEYYVCVDKSWQQHKCGLNHYFDVSLSLCVPDEKGFCAQLTAECVENEQRAYPLNCTAYEVCHGGKWQRSSCAVGEAFNTVLNACVPNDGYCAVNGLRRVCQLGETRRVPLKEQCMQFLYCGTDDTWHVGECLEGLTYFEDGSLCVPHAVDDSCEPLKSLNSVHVGVTQDNKNPCAGQEDGALVPHEYDCRRFHICLHEASISNQRCNDDGFFDVLLGYCRPNDGTCKIFLTGVCENAIVDALLPNPDDCSSYFLCSLVNGTQLLYCPEGEYFKDKKCRIDTGECQKRAGICAGHAHGVRLPHGEYCNIYYACVHGLAFPVECPENQLFNVTLNHCIPDKLNQCQNGNLIHDNSTAQDCSMRTDGAYVPDTVDCTCYYICSNGIALPQCCGPHTYFDSEQLLCVPDDGSCPFVDSGDAEGLSPPDPSICEGKHGSMLPDPINCNNFYICINGKLRHERCYENEFFNATIKQCQPFAEELTTEKPSKEAANHLTKLQQCPHQRPNMTELCKEITGGGPISEPSDCRRYINCQEGELVTQRCRNGESFDSLLGFCRQTDGSCLLDNGQRIGECNKLHGKLARNAENCHAYYVCIHGQQIPSECDEGEFFDRNLNICQKDVLHQCNEATTKTDEKSGVNCSNFKESILYPYVEYECHLFFQCIKGVPKMHECPAGLYFNATIVRCVEELNECVQPAVLTEEDESDDTNNICKKALIGYPYPNPENQCQSYYICDKNGVANYRDCYDGTRFDITSGICIEADQAMCPF